MYIDVYCVQCSMYIYMNSIFYFFNVYIFMYWQNSYIIQHFDINTPQHQWQTINKLEINMLKQLMEDPVIKDIMYNYYEYTTGPSVT